MTKKEKILSRLEQHQECAKRFLSEKTEILGTFLIGSQNYNLDNSQSDIDSKVVIIPDFEEITSTRPPRNQVISFENEKINIIDYRLLPKFFNKGFNYLELLFTDYYIIDSYYEDCWDMLRQKREDLAYWHPMKFYNAVFGMIRSLEQQVHKSSLIDGDAYDTKALARMYFLSDLIFTYYYGCDFKDCLHSCDREEYLRIKEGFITPDEAIFLSHRIVQDVSHLEALFALMPEGDNDKLNHLLTKFRIALFSDYADNNLSSYAYY